VPASQTLAGGKRPRMPSFARMVLAALLLLLLLLL